MTFLAGVSSRRKESRRKSYVVCGGGKMGLCLPFNALPLFFQMTTIYTPTKIFLLYFLLYIRDVGLVVLFINVIILIFCGYKVN
jgi:hypothetical protein